ncbi:hypothetical protein MASSI9I_20221 [Massilia sp. 9I]|nr:hypothetical protein MASSI9I_20221 [Massilia sp. 9I]
MAQMHVLEAAGTILFKINGLSEGVQASSHLYPQKMCRCELSLPTYPERRISHAWKSRDAHKTLLYG